jgi:hypothetical protein
LSRNLLSTERFSEPERTLILAILATRDAADELVIAAIRTSEVRLDIGIADTLPSRQDRPGSGVSTLAHSMAISLGRATPIHGLDSSS